MIHKVVWQHMNGVVGFLINQFTANLPRNIPAKKIGKSAKISQDYGHESEFVASLFCRDRPKAFFRLRP